MSETIEFLDKGGAIQLVQEIKTKVEEIASSMTKEFSAVIGVNWSGDTSPYTQTIEIWDLLATDNPIIDVVPSSNYQDASNQLDDWSEIFKITTTDHNLIVYSHRPTSVQIPIRILCIRPYSV